MNFCLNVQRYTLKIISFSEQQLNVLMLRFTTAGGRAVVFGQLRLLRRLVTVCICFHGNSQRHETLRTDGQ